jgi:GntR family transcriptional regulator
MNPATERESRIEASDLARDGLSVLLSAKGVSFDAIEDEVEARMPTPLERQRLQILDGVPVLDVVRTIRADGRVAAVIETVIAADLISLRYSLPQS